MSPEDEQIDEMHRAHEKQEWTPERIASERLVAEQYAGYPHPVVSRLAHTQLAVLDEIAQLTAAVSCYRHACERLTAQLAAAERNVASLDRALDQERQIFPAEGVFMVTGDGRSWSKIAELGEIPEPVAFARFARHIDAIAGAIVQVRASIEVEAEPPDATLRWTDPSARDYAEAIVRAVYAADMSATIARRYLDGGEW